MRTAFYVRVSTERQQQAQTIEQQVALLRAYVAERPDWFVEEQHVFRDDGHTGAKLQRPGLDALRDKAARAAYPSAVAAWVRSDLATNAADAYKLWMPQIVEFRVRDGTPGEVLQIAFHEQNRCPRCDLEFARNVSRRRSGRYQLVSGV